jgi:hypothetical protein
MTEGFREDSPLLHRVMVPTRVVVHQNRLSPREVAALKAAGEYGPIPEEERLCVLEAGGVPLARGRIVRRRGRVYFKVVEAGGDR